MEPRTVYELFERTVAASPGGVAYRTKFEGRWRDVTWADEREAVTGLAKSLLATGLGRGDKVAILASTRLEWVQCDTAIVSTGGVTVGIYHSCLGPDCAYVIEHSEAALLFVEDAAQWEKIREHRGSLPRLKRVVIFDGPGNDSEGVMAWRDFLALGSDVPDAEVVGRGRALAPDDLASLVYTSGTTGHPKGAMISHANLLFTARAATGCLQVESGETTLLFLPLAHIFARMIVYLCTRLSLTIAFAEEIGKIAENMKEVRPHFILSVPRIYEKFHDRIVEGGEQAGGLRRLLFRWAIGVGRRVARRRLAGDPVPRGLALARALADRLVLRRVREALGGRLRFCVSGAAPLNPDLCEFFLAFDIPLIEGLGMTENTSLSNVNHAARMKPGSVGPVVPGVEMKLAPDGEVLFRGGNVMAGYYKDAQATAEAIDADGWLHSGDIGEIDEDGFLKITDRKKDLIVTAGGKNIAPQKIETLLRQSPYIGQAVAFGDGRKYIVALIALETANVRRWAAALGLHSTGPAGWPAHPEVRKLIEYEVSERNRALASYETVKKFRILPHELGIDTGELTPTLKPKRKVISAKYAGLLDEMYQS